MFPLLLPILGLLLTVLESTLVGVVETSNSNYRHINLDNTDICSHKERRVNIFKRSRSEKMLEIGYSGVIIQLDSPSKTLQPSYTNERLCQIHVRSPDNTGVIAYVQSMFLRQNLKSKECVDNLQFAQDDRIPFVTVEKSDTFCGRVEGDENVNYGITYDDPYGNMLIWLSLGGRRTVGGSRPFSDVNLTLILTPYKYSCRNDNQYTSCNSHKSREKCIHKSMFCDTKFNCGNLTSTSSLAVNGHGKSIDEFGCVYHHSTNGTNSTVDDSEMSYRNRFHPPNIWRKKPLNQISFLIIVVCATLSASLGILLSVRVGRYFRHYLQRRTSSSCTMNQEDEEEGDEVMSLHQLSQRRTERGRAQSAQNIYSTPSYHRSGRRRGSLQTEQDTLSSAIRNSLLPTDNNRNDHCASGGDTPPPTYDQLFPSNASIPRNFSM